MNMPDSYPQLKVEGRKARFRFFWIRLRSPILIVEILVPFLIDGLCGHFVGSLAAIGNIIGWLYFGLKSHMAPGTRMIWLAAIAFTVTIAVVEFAHLFHWQLTSNGHFYTQRHK